jgi:hypothetical protein
MSPVRVPGGGGPLVWGSDGTGAVVLAGALLADTLGPEYLCSGCLGAIPACPDCDSTGLDRTIRQLAVAFAGDVVRTLPVGGFEMRVGDVIEWARLHTATDVRRLQATSL